MRKLALTLEYDGTDFLGWQIQAAGRTVQGAVESVLKTILQEDIRITAAGRTDTGVHAAGQVAHFTTASTIPLDRLQAGISSLLPPDIVMRHLREVDEAFHARYSATGRQYRYRILLRPSALRHRYAWYVRYTLDLDAITRACGALVGTHDFTSFCRAEASAGGAECHVRRLRWRRDEDEIFLDIEANRFLHNMVRAIVGTAVDIGRGYRSPDDMVDMLKARDRRMAGSTAPPHGLCLVRVLYPDKLWLDGH